MSIFDRTKDEGLNANVRPGALNVRGQQKFLFPFDAFLFPKDPASETIPRITLKTPWQMEGNIIGGQLISADYQEGVEGLIIDLENNTARIESLIAQLQDGDEVKSHDFQTGVAGWAIFGDGSAEFSDMTARGTIEADGGSIAGWTINETYLGGGSLLLYGSGSIQGPGFTLNGSGLNLTSTAGINIGSGAFQVNSGGAVTATNLTITGGSIDLNSGVFEVDSAGNLVASSATITGDITAETGELVDLSVSGTVTIGVGGSVVAGDATLDDSGITGTGYSLTTSGITASSGTIGGWIIGTLLKSAASGARVELNPAENRISVFDSSAEKVVMGYLDGLAKHDGSGNWGSSDYGFWAASGDELRIDGAVDYVSGDWIVRNDAALKIYDSSDAEVLRVGTDAGDRGLHFYDSDTGDLMTSIIPYVDSGGTPIGLLIDGVYEKLGIGVNPEGQYSIKTANSIYSEDTVYGEAGFVSYGPMYYYRSGVTIQALMDDDQISLSEPYSVPSGLGERTPQIRMWHNDTEYVELKVNSLNGLDVVTDGITMYATSAKTDYFGWTFEPSGVLLRTNQSITMNAPITMSSVTFTSTTDFESNVQIGGNYFSGDDAVAVQGASGDIYAAGDLTVDGAISEGGSLLTNKYAGISHTHSGYYESGDSPVFAQVTIGTSIVHDGDTNTYMEFHAADQWRVVTNGTERLEVNNTGVTASGDILPSTDDTYNIGSASKTWNEVHVDDLYVTDLFPSLSVGVIEVHEDLAPGVDSTWDLGTASQAWANIYGDVLYQGGEKVVESGSNADGSWVKYADGTMICWEIIGGGNATEVWDFPVAFVGSVPIVTANLQGTSRSDRAYSVFTKTGDEPSLTSAGKFYKKEIDDGVNVVSNETIADIHAVAIGKWK